ncbi:phosphatase PAP2 family protein [Terrabacter sp. NPDC080008]|uniref:phosphatase PAP2 family protein n=1 Tax=Terrabacter sp. NPDC080008 TaxID=3155176 RepID=UPI00344BEA61
MALLLAVGLVVVTTSVVVGGPTVRVDDVVKNLTPGQDAGPGALGLLALVVVDIATPALCVALVAAFAVALALLQRRWAPVLLAAPALALLTGTVLLGKAVIPRGGPISPEIIGGLGSYPSGHTATALVCAGVVAELVSRLHPRRRRLAWSLAVAWTLVVAASLVWLHFHWLSDVVGSMFLGSLLLWLLLRWPLRLGARVAQPWRDGGPIPGR